MVRYWKIKYPGGEGLTSWDELADKVDGIANSDFEDAGQWEIVDRFDVENNDSSETKAMRSAAAENDDGSLPYGPRWSTKGVFCAMGHWEIKNGDAPQGNADEGEAMDEISDGSGSDVGGEGSDEEMEDVEGYDEGGAADEHDSVHGKEDESSLDYEEFDELVDSYYGS